jgi:hypothetical protein
LIEMTPAELRRLADRKIAEAGSLSTAAERLRPEAAALGGVLEPLVAMSTRVWVGPAAHAFEDETRSRGRVLEQQADRLNRIADEFAARARRLRAEASSLRAQAAAAEAAAAAASAGLPIPGGVS